MERGYYLPKGWSKDLKKTRERLKLTQEMLAITLGVSFQSVNRWENGRAIPSRLSWERIKWWQESVKNDSCSPQSQSPLHQGVER